MTASTTDAINRSSFDKYNVCINVVHGAYIGDKFVSITFAASVVRAVVDVVVVAVVAFV